MKKIVLSIFVAALTAVGANAQGTWKATGTEPAIDPTTSIETGITGLVVMHNDGAGVVGQTDGTAETVTYDDVTWDNLAFIQGTTNGMFYAFAPSSNGTLEVSVKMGSAKPTVVAATDDPIETVAAKIAASGGDKQPAKNNLTDPTYPDVYDTYNNSVNVWDLSASSSADQSIQNTGGNVYLVMSFSVTGGKTYIVSVTGSKLMLRGIKYVTDNTGITAPALEISKEIKSEEYFDLTGKKIIGDIKKAVLIKKTTYIDGTVSNSKVINIQ